MQFILRATDANAVPGSELLASLSQGGVEVLDVGARMLLVDAKQRTELQRVMQEFEHWQVLDEHMQPLPDTRPRLVQVAGK